MSDHEERLTEIDINAGRLAPADPQYQDAEINLRKAVNWKPNEPSIREQILDEAKRVVTSDRNLEYGPAEENFDTIARLWTTYFIRRGLIAPDVKVEPFDTAIAQILVKVARVGVSPTKDDHYVDIAGYAAAAAQCATGKEK